ncbi:MAG: peptide deformylase [Candidatus Bipolaricaulota bacterium]|nr:peptide deformylase [Candidatus Bipolaricaulota bacterium]MDW8127047.1 peptide deformylase [Candidatus Bipolaricaulota bacterium]
MVRVYPDPILRKPTHPVRPGSPDARAIAEALRGAFSRIEGLGLAANQLGFLSRVAIVRLSGEGAEDHGERAPIIMLNPRILWRSEDIVVDEEGCLSIPGVWADVPRAKSVRVEYQDEEGQRHIIEVEGLDARLIQHELDHLDGVLFIDHLSVNERQRVLRVFRELQLRKEGVPSAAQVRA